MFARTAASAVAAFIFAALAVSSAGSGEFPAQHTWTSVVSASTTDEPLQHSSGNATSFDATGLTKLAAPAVIHQPARTEPFGLATTTVSADHFVTMWDIMENRIRADREVLMRCRELTKSCSTAAQSLLAIVAEGRQHDGRARIGVINRAINLIIQAASVNYWTAPLETLAMGRGNCKQYAIAKYIALIEAGIDENDVKLVIVRDLATGENHAVVAVHLNSDWIILDNRWLSMVQDTDMRGVIPLLVLDRDGVKRYLPTADDE